MFIEYPKALYLGGSPDADLVFVRGAEEEAQARSRGFRMVQDPAPEGAPSSQPIPDDDAPPTRAELEHKARELGIKFDGRTGDKKLSALIEAKLGG